MERGSGWRQQGPTRLSVRAIGLGTTCKVRMKAPTISGVLIRSAAPPEDGTLRRHEQPTSPNNPCIRPEHAQPR